MGKGWSWDWFNASAPMWLMPVKWRRWVSSVRLWNLHNRRSSEGWWWGIGVLQIGRRHLLYLGDRGVCVAFVWLLDNPERR